MMRDELRLGITGDFFKRIIDKEVFEAEVFHDFFERCEEMGIVFTWNRRNALDAFFEWQQDLSRLAHAEPHIEEPDHLKCAAYLIYWLRRSSPVENFVYEGEVTPEVEFMIKYGREYLAFDLGYRAAQNYERFVNDRNLPQSSFSLHSSLEDVLENDFIETVCHVLKLKMVSPSSLLLLLKAIFLRP